MRRRPSSTVLLAAAATASFAIAARPASAELLELTKTVAGTAVHYKVVLPNGYDPAKAYPAILALGGERVLPDFLKMVLAEYRIQGGKFHIAGPSNGGIAAFHVGAAYPHYFLSVTAFPGYMWRPTPPKLQAIANLCVFMYVGEFDHYMWHGEMQREAAFLRARGTLARYTVEKGQPHGIETLAGAGAARLFDGFDEAAKGCVSRDPSRESASTPRGK